MTHLAAVFERSPELTARLEARLAPDDTPEDVIEKARAILDTFAERELIAVLNAHPRIGADVRELSELSRVEQGSDQDPRVLTELVRLNAAYERNFGFRFVVFVNGRSKAQILDVLRERATRSREAELRTGIDEFLVISLDRLRKMRART
ncbi:MAG TPA: 2-oxo-4-hydroxy-4-carboxy-5-ureidoimidazoline decarboxylase [Candidatus Acidoferrales bacterium]|nr:2-oxo-4-hydroxy-4-carboxy-5-ureidoimidazoline decarboxylase [Candidatus Acidoferrales bacterium]